MQVGLLKNASMKNASTNLQGWKMWCI